MNTFAKLVEALTIPLGLLNVFGAIVGGIWLAFRGEWGMIGYGVAATFFSVFALGLAMMPGVLLASPAAVLHEKGSQFSFYVFGFLSSLYTISIIMIWCVGVLYFFVRQADHYSIIPILLWSYGVATAPLAWMAQKEDNEYAMISTFFAEVAYVLASLAILFVNVSLPGVLLLFGVVMFIGLIIQFRFASEAEKQKALYDKMSEDF